MAFKTKEQQLASLHFSLQHSSVLKTSQRLVQVMDLVWVRRDKHLDNLDCWQCCCCGQIHFRGGEEPRVEGQREAFRDGIHKNPLHCNMLQMTRVTRRVTTLRPTMQPASCTFIWLCRVLWPSTVNGLTLLWILQDVQVITFDPCFILCTLERTTPTVMLLN